MPLLANNQEIQIPKEELELRTKEFEGLCESHQSVQRLELSKIVPQQNVPELRSQAVKRLQECGVVCIRPIRGKFESFQLPQDLSENTTGNSTMDLPFQLAPLTEQSIAVSYRHGGKTIHCRVQNEDGTGLVSLEADEHAIAACMATGTLNVSFWIDCVCIQSAGHSVSKAFGYMGHLYASLPVFSEINWKQSKEEVLNYLSRCWVFQEFLIAEQRILPPVYDRIVAMCPTLNHLGQRVQTILTRCIGVYPRPGTELRQLATDFHELLWEMNQVFDTFECFVLSYWVNCAQTMWLFQMSRLGKILQCEPEEYNEIELGAKLADAVRSCSCIPLVLFVSKQDVARATRLQMPTTDILGRLEAAYIQLNVHTESDRSYAIFGVYNKLAGETVHITGPVFRGLWPAIRGTKLTSQSCTSGFSSGTHVYLLPLMMEDEVMASVEILIPFAPPQGGADKPRFVIVAYERRNAAAKNDFEYCGRAIWTYGCLPQSCITGDFKAAFDCIRVFAEEIDSLFGVATGSCSGLFKAILDEGSSLAPFEVETESASLYTKRLQFAVKESLHVRVP
jgi:hypothetical protein